MKWIFVTTPLRARGGYWGRCTSPITDPDSGHGVSSSEDSFCGFRQTRTASSHHNDRAALHNLES
eukprot:4131647-Prymnesium_polylepis.1